MKWDVFAFLFRWNWEVTDVEIVQQLIRLSSLEAVQTLRGFDSVWSNHPSAIWHSVEEGERLTTADQPPLWNDLVSWTSSFSNSSLVRQNRCLSFPSQEGMYFTVIASKSPAKRDAENNVYLTLICLIWRIIIYYLVLLFFLLYAYFKYSFVGMKLKPQQSIQSIGPFSDSQLTVSLLPCSSSKQTGLFSRLFFLNSSIWIGKATNSP